MSLLLQPAKIRPSQLGMDCFLPYYLATPVLKGVIDLAKKLIALLSALLIDTFEGSSSTHRHLYLCEKITTDDITKFSVLQSMMHAKLKLTQDTVSSLLSVKTVPLLA